MSSVVMTVRGEKRRVSLEKELTDGSYRARIREYGTGNSIRGIARQRSDGQWRFYATNPENLDS